MANKCCLCGKKPSGNDWCQWQLGKGQRLVSCHESCVVDLIRKTVQEREQGQRLLFVPDAASEVCEGKQ